MNTPRLAHISISIFRHCRSVLFSVDAASYFPASVVFASIIFLYARDREFRKNIKNEKGRESLPISFLMSVFVSYLGVVNTHTHTVFSLISHRISSERTKNWVMKNVCAFTRIQRKKKEGRIYTRFENGSNSIGIKKSREEREREEEIKQASNR